MSSSTSAGQPAVPTYRSAANAAIAGVAQRERERQTSATRSSPWSVKMVRRSRAVPLVVRQVVVRPDLCVGDAEELEGPNQDVAPPGLARHPDGPQDLGKVEADLQADL